MATAILHPTTELAPRVLLPGDPGRALALAQLLLERPLMFNHNRGLWGYTGTALDGAPLTIQASGVGGPSAVAVLAALCDLGIEQVVRVGTCRGPLEPGALVTVTGALAGDGASRALGAGAVVEPDAGLTAALADATPLHGVVASADLYDSPLPDGDALARDLSSAAVLQLARVRGIRAAAVLAVVDPSAAADEQALAALVETLGRAGAQALVG